MWVGQVIADKYIIQGRIHGAGKSELADATYGGHRFVVKRFLSPVFPARTAPDSFSVERRRAACQQFERQRQRIADLLPRCDNERYGFYEFFREGGNYYDVYSYIESSDYAERLVRSDSARVEIVRSLVDSVRRLHACGIVHSDINPSNVLIGFREGRPGVTLIDFGDAFMVGDPPRRYGGDIAFASPELETLLTRGYGGTPALVGTASDMFLSDLLFTCGCMEFCRRFHRTYTDQRPPQCAPAPQCSSLPCPNSQSR